MKTLLKNAAIYSVALLAGCSAFEPEPFGIRPQELSDEGIAKHSAASGRIGSVPLGTASNFAVLAGTTVTSAGESLISENLGVSPGTAITGFQPAPLNTIMGPGTVTAGLGMVSGTIYAGGPVAEQAHVDASIAYNYLVAQVADNTFNGVTQLDGLTFTPGVYYFAPSANLQVNGTMYLDFQGDSDAQFIFQMGTTLVTMTGSNILALNNNENDETCIGSNVYWAVGSSATIDGAQFIGTVIAHTTITMTNDATVSGRILALNGAVTMINDKISSCTGTIGEEPVPTKSCDFVTGGGWVKTTSNSKATFGVSGGIKHGKFWGNLSFNDHSTNGVQVKSTSITGYTHIDVNTRKIQGTAKVNGQEGFSYTVIVTDRNEPGRNDSFSIDLSNGYAVSGGLSGGGNIQLHKKCGESKDDHDGYNDNHNKYDKHDSPDHKNGGKNK